MRRPHLSRRPPRDPAGLTVAISGGARGIGAATAERLHRAGADVVVGDIDPEALRGLADRLGVRHHRLDVTSAESWREFAAVAGEVDVLVNNAGIMLVGPILEEDEATTRAMVDVNLHGVILGTRAVAPGMVERGRGHLVNVASAVGRLAEADGATYTATKFAVVGLSEATRLELEPHGVDVSLVMPTVVRTEMAAGVRQARGVREIGPEDVAEVIEDVVRVPRPETWVPRWTGQVSRVTRVLPWSAQLRMAQLFRADVLHQRDDAARAAYEARVRGTAGAE